MSILYSTTCPTCLYDFSKLFYRKVVNKESLETVMEDLKMSRCLMSFIGHMNTIKLFGAPKHDAIIRKSNNDIIPIQY